MSTPSSVSFCTTSSGFAPFVSANATTRRGSSSGSTTTRAGGVQVDHAGPDAHDGVRRANARAVGHGDALTGAEAAHPPR